MFGCFAEQIILDGLSKQGKGGKLRWLDSFTFLLSHLLLHQIPKL